MYLLSPFFTTAEAIRTLTSRHDKNPFKNGNTLSGKKKGVCKFDLDCTLPQMKQFCKQNDVTFNDFVFAVMSNSIYEYFQKYKSEGPPNQQLDSVQCGFAMSLRESASSLE